MLGLVFIFPFQGLGVLDLIGTLKMDPFALFKGPGVCESGSMDFPGLVAQVWGSSSDAHGSKTSC